MDQLFEDMFRDYSDDELAAIKAKYGTEGDVLEAPLLIAAKAKDNAPSGLPSAARTRQPAAGSCKRSLSPMSLPSGIFFCAPHGGGTARLMPANPIWHSDNNERTGFPVSVQFLLGKRTSTLVRLDVTSLAWQVCPFFVGGQGPAR